MAVFHIRTVKSVISYSVNLAVRTKFKTWISAFIIPMRWLNELEKSVKVVIDVER